MSKHENWNPREYKSLSDIKNELDAMEAANQAGTLKTFGKWNAGQIFEHCSIPMKMAYDGFFDEQGKEVKMPLLARMFGIVVFKNILGKSHMKPGIKLPASAASMIPADDCTFEQGIGSLRAQLARVDNGEKMTQKSPFLGKMRHEQWLLLHIDHCRMHFGFIQYPGCDANGDITD